MKVDVANYVSSCGVCQRVKAEHKRPARFVAIFGRFQNGHGMIFPWILLLAYLVCGEGKDAVWVVVNRLSEFAHFIPIRTTDSSCDLWHQYMCGRL
jgi:hypothetical protein